MNYSMTSNDTLYTLVLNCVEKLDTLTTEVRELKQRLEDTEKPSSLNNNLITLLNEVQTATEHKDTLRELVIQLLDTHYTDEDELTTYRVKQDLQTLFNEERP